MEEINNPVSYMFYYLNIVGKDNITPSFVSEFRYNLSNYSSAIDLDSVPPKRWRDLENYKKDRDKLIEKYNGELGNN